MQGGFRKLKPQLVWDFCLSLWGGCSSPASRRSRSRWNLAEQRDPDAYLKGLAHYPLWEQNYLTVQRNPDAIEEVLDEQAAKGPMFTLSEADAKLRYGRELVVAALGAAQKSVADNGDVEYRVLHDGTHHVHVNDAIRVRDAVQFPIASDAKRVLRAQAETGQPHFGLTADVEEAHHAVAIDPRDWPLLACQVRLGGKVYFNTRGTFGIAGAGYCWGCLGAAGRRAVLYVLGSTLPMWAMLFSDDWDFTVEAGMFARTLLTALWVLHVFAFPIKRRKCRGDFVLGWLQEVLERVVTLWSLLTQCESGHFVKH